ncbi:MAG: hypothetical protein PHV30_11650 [Candidatus Margulisbacteria bacterium]|nr:hypothetical protein [Candidatus Margulisiibacteriota bacterium]
MLLKIIPQKEPRAFVLQKATLMLDSGIPKWMLPEETQWEIRNLFETDCYSQDLSKFKPSVSEEDIIGLEEKGVAQDIINGLLTLFNTGIAEMEIPAGIYTMKIMGMANELGFTQLEIWVSGLYNSHIYAYFIDTTNPDRDVEIKIVNTVDSCDIFNFMIPGTGKLDYDALYKTTEQIRGELEQALRARGL